MGSTKSLSGLQERLKVGDKIYEPLEIVDHIDEILSYFSGSKINTPDLRLFNSFIDILWKGRKYNEALYAIGKALEKYPGSTCLQEKKAEIKLDAGKADGAAEIFKELYEKFPRRHQVAEGLGKALFLKGKLDEAEEILMEALEIDTWDPDYLIAQFEIFETLAKIYCEKGKYREALECVEEVIELSPRQSKWQLYLKLLKKLGKNSELKEAREIHKDVTRARRYASRASKYESQGKLELALRNYKKAIKENPNEPHYYFNVANILEKLPEDEYEFQHEEATAYYKKAVDLFPDNFFYISGYVGNLITVNQLEKAYKIARMAAESYPEYMMPSLRHICEHLDVEGKYIEILRQIVNTDEENELAEPRIELALLLQDRNLSESRWWLDEASKIYLEKIKAEPYHWRNYYDYACARYELKDFDGASEYFIKAMDLHGEFSIDIAEKLSDVLFRQKKFKDAKLLLEALVLIYPKDYDYLGKMGLCFLALEQYEHAYEAFNRSIFINNYNPEYLYGAAVAAANVKKSDDTINLIKDLLQFNPDFAEIVEKEPVFKKLKAREAIREMTDKIKAEKERLKGPEVTDLKKINVPVSKNKKVKS